MDTPERAETPIPGAAEPAIVRFWRAAYRRYERPVEQGVGFHVPELPVPLLSPNFITGDRAVFLKRNERLLAHFNEIVPLGHEQRELPPFGWRLDRQFYLGERVLEPVPVALPAGVSARELPLAEALHATRLPELLADGFPRDAPFLRERLLPFLATLEAEFRTVLLEEGGETLGVITVGVAGGEALVLNAVVAKAARGRGLSAALVDLARNAAVALGARRAFFWTEHPFLGRHAGTLAHYRVFARA